MVQVMRCCRRMRYGASSRGPQFQRHAIVSVTNPCQSCRIHFRIIEHHVNSSELTVMLPLCQCCNQGCSVSRVSVANAAGDALFQTHENMEHLAMMEAVLGPIPQSMAQAAKGAHNYFIPRDWRLNWPADASKRSIRSASATKLPRLCGLVECSPTFFL